MADIVKIAAVQMEPRITEVQDNLNKINVSAETAARSGATLIVFPECALTGYVFGDDEFKVYAQSIPGTATRTLARLCQKLNVHMIAGLLEKSGSKYFNTAVLVGPNGLIGRYRKVHLPFLGVDRFLDRGDEPFEIYRTDVGNIGINICYDCNFPESARILTLLGADIIALPTNWPEGRERIAKFVAPTRAYENKVYLVAVNRVGIERGTTFIGQSKIIDTQGDTLAEASLVNEEILYADADLSKARQKQTIFKPGEFEVDLINDRRPGFYRKINDTE